MVSGKLFHNDFLPWVLGWKKQEDLGLTVVQLPKTPLMRTLNFLSIPITVLLRNNLWDVCGMLWKKKCLTFQTILKPLSCKRSWRCGRLGPRSCLGERVGDFSSSGQEPGAASKLRGPGGLSVHPEVHLCSSLGPQHCLPFKVPCCLRKHAKYFRKGLLCGSNRK